MPFTADEEPEKDLIDYKNLKFVIVERPWHPLLRDRPQTLDIQESNKAETHQELIDIKRVARHLT